MSSFGIHITLKGRFDATCIAAKEALEKEGFGVLTEIDLKATLKKKLAVDFRRYTILGACNPPLAHRALNAALDIGLMLPCNVIIYEEDGDFIHVAAIDPLQTLGTQGGPELEAVARDVRDRLKRVIDWMGQPSQS